MHEKAVDSGVKNFAFLSMLAVWYRVCDETTSTCGWDVDTRNSPAAFVDETLPHVQHRVLRVVCNRASTIFLAKFDKYTDSGRQGAARMLSAACGPSSGWVTAPPCAPCTRSSDGDFVFAGRHLFGLGVATAEATQPCQSWVTMLITATMQWFANQLPG